MNTKLPLSLVAFLLIAGSAYADGNITGTVYDKRTSEPLDFATVVLVNPETGLPLSMGAMTDENGMFVIPNAPCGKYIIRVSMVGSIPQEREITVADSDIDAINGLCLYYVYFLKINQRASIL